jgi:aromatic-L-amino-acid decarboxylase
MPHPSSHSGHDRGPTEPASNTPADLPHLAQQAAAFLADYLTSLERRPVLPEPHPGRLLERLPSLPPEVPEADPWAAIYEDLDRLIVPGLTHWQSPRFFGYFPCNHSVPAIVAELLSAGLNVNAMLWATSPAATELEQRTLDWFAHAFGLPESFTFAATNAGGCIQGTASEATLAALCAARHRARAAARARGRTTVHLTLYTSEQAHSSVTKAAMIAGLADGPEDRTHLRLIPTDPAGAILAEALGQSVRADLAGGLVPAFATLTVGTTGTEAVDSIAACVRALDDAARAFGHERFPGWVHVDAAFTGAALVCPEFRRFFSGIERADSVCINPHKWLLTNFDCDLFWTRDRAALTGALSITPEYLRTASDAADVVNYRDWQVPLGRRFRALKLWLVLRCFGLSGLREHIRGHVACAERFESLVRADPRFEITAPRTTSLVCFRLCGEDGRSERLLSELNAERHVLLSHTRLPSGPGGTPGRYTLRCAIGATLTRQRHIDETWAHITRAADRVLRHSA